MKILISLLIATALYADSKTEKDLRAKVAAAEQERDEARQSKAAAIAMADRSRQELQKENARIATENNGYRGKLIDLTEANNALRSQLNSQLEAAKLQAGAVKALAESDKGKTKAISDAVAGTIAHTATIRHAENAAALDRNADLTEQLGEEIVALRELISEMATNQVADHEALVRHGQLLEHQVKMDSWLFWLSIFVGAEGVVIIGALIFYFGFIHE